MKGHNNKMIHRLFAISIISKGIDGVLETAGGGLLWMISPARMGLIIRLLTQHELSEDPHDLLAGYLAEAAQHLSADARIFAAVFLLWHGLVKIGLVVALLQKRFWAYPAAIGAFALFLIYQLYRYMLAPSAWLLVLSVADLFVIIITCLEYKRLRALQGFA